MSASPTALNPSKTTTSPNDQPWANKLKRVHDKRYLLLRMAVGRVLADSVWYTYRYGYLIHRNHELNEAWPGNTRVAANIGKSVRTVQRHKQLLDRFGFIEIIRRSGIGAFRQEGAEGRTWKWDNRRTDRIWFCDWTVGDVTPRHPPMSSKLPKSYSNGKTKTSAHCNHPWGEPLGYPHTGSWRCATCGDIYSRKEGVK